MKITKGDYIFKISVHIMVVVMSLIIIIPFMHVISISLSSEKQIYKSSVGILPKETNLFAYIYILKDHLYLRSFMNSIFYTATTTFAGMVFNTMCAYAFSKKFFGKKFLNYILIIPMYFTGGLIPFYLLVTKYLGWYNSVLALTVPILYCYPLVANIFYIIVIRSQIEQLPQSLLDAAKIDGAKEYQLLFRIVIPTITPTLAAIGMFIALLTWNTWFYVMIFTNSNKLWSLQYFLRSVIYDKAASQSASVMSFGDMVSMYLCSENIQMATVILVALPVMLIYPFIQKFFVKGLLLGSIKE